MRQQGRGKELYKLLSDAGKLKARYHSVMSSATELVATINNAKMTQWAWARNDETVGFLMMLHRDLAAQVQADPSAAELLTRPRANCARPTARNA